MIQNQQRLEPIDFGEYEKNRVNFPVDELIKYAGKFIAFSPDGKRIVAHGETEEALEEMLKSLGIHWSRVVHSYVDPLEV